MLWVLIRSASARGGASNEYPQHMYSSRNKKKILCGYPLLSAAMNTSASQEVIEAFTILSDSDECDAIGKHVLRIFVS